MLLKPAHLEIHRLASTDQMRVNLNGIHLYEKDGKTVSEATNGHYGITVTSPTESGEDFPTIDGFSQGVGLNPSILPVDAARDILKSIPKKTYLPVLKKVAIDTAESNKNGHLKMAVNDLESPKVFTPRKIASQFPDMKAVRPTGDAKAYCGINAQYLKDIAETFLAIGKGLGESKTVCLRMEVREPGTPVTFFLEVDGVKVEALLMPMRLDR